MLIVERWILARLRHVRFFSLSDLNAAIGMLLEDLNNRPMRRLGRTGSVAGRTRSSPDLKPSSVDEWLPEKHQARFVVE